LKFWGRELTLKGDYADFVAASLDPAYMTQVYPARIDPYIVELQTRFGGRLRVLDVGCGPASLLSLGHLRGSFDLTGVDPLTSRYQTILGRDRPVSVGSLQTGFGETLSSLFPPESFHLVYMCNALDHSQSPSKVLSQMCRALKPGGVLFLQGYVREGSANEFHGLHKHDLYLLAEGRLMCRSRTWPLGNRGRVHSLSDNPPLSVLAQTEPFDEVKGFLRVTYRKHG